MRWCLSDSNSAESDAENQAPHPDQPLTRLPVHPSEKCRNAGWYHLLCLKEKENNKTVVPQFPLISQLEEKAVFSSLDLPLARESYLYLNQQFCLSSFRINPRESLTP